MGLSYYLAQQVATANSKRPPFGGSAADRLHDLARVGEAPGLVFAPHLSAVGEHGERAADAAAQLDLGARKRSLDLGGQTDRPGFVASHHAVFDRHLHEPTVPRGISGA
jgi:hypothetical protein